MINVKLSNEKPTVPGYPKLMAHKADPALIVLFESMAEGTVVSVGAYGCYKIGQHYNAWNYDQFEDYAGRVTLENC